MQTPEVVLGRCSSMHSAPRWMTSRLPATNPSGTPRPLWSGALSMNSDNLVLALANRADAVSDTIFLAFGGSVLLEVSASNLFPVSTSAAVNLVQGLVAGAIPLVWVVALAFAGCMLVVGIILPLADAPVCMANVMASVWVDDLWLASVPSPGYTMAAAALLACEDGVPSSKRQDGAGPQSSENDSPLWCPTSRGRWVASADMVSAMSSSTGPSMSVSPGRRSGRAASLGFWYAGFGLLQEGSGPSSLSFLYN